MTSVCYLDLDGVLVDFVGGALAVHGKHMPAAEVRWGFPAQIGFSGADDPAFWQPLGFDFWANLNWTPAGRDLLAGVEAIFADRVVLMTSPCDTPGGVEGKVAWVRRNLPGYSRRFFVGPAKHLAAAPGKILVDDHDANCERFRAHGGAAVLVPCPWNQASSQVDAHGRPDVQGVLAELARLTTR